MLQAPIQGDSSATCNHPFAMSQQEPLVTGTGTVGV
jgi:hypothetical protein